MRCLITKEIAGLTRSKFWLGDFMKALESWDQSYDLIVACGVLYHIKEPLRLLELAARRSRAIYIWTHVVTEEALPPSDPRHLVLAPTLEVHQFHGIDVRAYRRTDGHAEDNVTFCRDTNDGQRWLHRGSVVDLPAPLTPRRGSAGIENERDVIQLVCPSVRGRSHSVEQRRRLTTGNPHGHLCI
jgi:hypothetical protein